MGTYNLPRNVKGEGRILFIFSPPVFLVISKPFVSGILNIPIAYPIKANINVITIPTIVNPISLNIK